MDDCLKCPVCRVWVHSQHWTIGGFQCPSCGAEIRVVGAACYKCKKRLSPDVMLVADKGRSD